MRISSVLLRHLRQHGLWLTLHRWTHLHVLLRKRHKALRSLDKLHHLLWLLWLLCCHWCTVDWVQYGVLGLHIYFVFWFSFNVMFVLLNVLLFECQHLFGNVNVDISPVLKELSVTWLLCICLLCLLRRALSCLWLIDWGLLLLDECRLLGRLAHKWKLHWMHHLLQLLKV